MLFLFSLMAATTLKVNHRKNNLHFVYNFTFRIHYSSYISIYFSNQETRFLVFENGLITLYRSSGTFNSFCLASVNCARLTVLGGVKKYLFL